MNTLRTLLVATDLSAPARHAVHRAGLLAADCGARLVLLHVVDMRLIEGLRHFLGESGELRERHLLDDVARVLSNLADGIARRFSIDVDPQLVTGSVLREIIAFADRSAADLLVMGSRGSGFVPELMLGTTTERALLMTRRPVLIVKQTPHEPYRRILVPVDFSSRAECAVDWARAVSTGAELSLMHAFDLPFERKLHYAGLSDVEMIELQAATGAEATRKMEALTRYAALSGAVSPSAIVYGRPTTRILEQEQEQDCDLIVIGRGDSGLLADWLLGSTTKRVAAQASCDLLLADLDGALSEAAESP